MAYVYTFGGGGSKPGERGLEKDLKRRLREANRTPEPDRRLSLGRPKPRGPRAPGDNASFGSRPLPAGTVGAGQQHLLPGNMLFGPDEGVPVVPILQQMSQQGGQAGGGGGGGGGGFGGFPPPTAPSAPDVKWSEADIDLDFAPYRPGWWKALTPSEQTESSNLMLMMNTMIPFLSPEDQVTTARQLYNMDPNEFSFYKPGNIPDVTTVSEDVARYRERTGQGDTLSGLPVEDIPDYSGPRDPSEYPLTPPHQAGDVALTDERKNYYLSGERARQIRRALSLAREESVGGNRHKLGPGYEWLQNVVGALESHGGVGGERTNRQSRLAQLSAVDPFLNQAKSGSLAPYGSLGQMLANPYFTAGPPMPTFEAPGGQKMFGFQNPRFM